MKRPIFWLRLLTAFGAGVALWEAIVHASLLVSGQSPKILGIKLAPRLNLVQTIVPGLTAGALGLFAFIPRRRTSFLSRLAPLRALADRVEGVDLAEGLVRA